MTQVKSDNKKNSPLSASLSIISARVDSSFDTEFLIMPTQMSVGMLVSDQSLTDGETLSAGKFYGEIFFKLRLPILSDTQFEQK